MKKLPVCLASTQEVGTLTFRVIIYLSDPESAIEAGTPVPVPVPVPGSDLLSVTPDRPEIERTINRNRKRLR